MWNDLWKAWGRPSHPDTLQLLRLRFTHCPKALARPRVMIGERFGRQLNGRKYANVSVWWQTKSLKKGNEIWIFWVKCKSFSSLLKSQTATLTACTADSTGRPFSLASFWPADTAAKRDCKRLPLTPIHQSISNGGSRNRLITRRFGDKRDSYGDGIVSKATWLSGGMKGSPFNGSKCLSERLACLGCWPTPIDGA